MDELLEFLQTCYAFVVNNDSHFVKDFLLPVLAAVAAGAILVIPFGGLKWPYKKHAAITLPIIVLSLVVAWAITSPTSKPEMSVAGTVVDESSNEPIGQAVVSLSDGSVRETSEDNGNFRLQLRGRLANRRVRIKVVKDGYRPFDATVEVPSEDLVVKLHHL